MFAQPGLTSVEGRRLATNVSNAASLFVYACAFASGSIISAPSKQLAADVCRPFLLVYLPLAAC